MLSDFVIVIVIVYLLQWLSWYNFFSIEEGTVLYGR